jgi:hypothetical protein
MQSDLHAIRRIWLPVAMTAWAVIGSRLQAAQPGPDDPPVTYEVQVDGESFQVESGQPPTKFESKLKKGVAYTLAVRVSMTQVLRLNSVRMEYGMWSRVYDDKAKVIRVAQIVNDQGFTLRVTDVGHLLDAKPADKLLDTLVDDAIKGYAKKKATVVSKKGPLAMKFGQSNGKGTKINFTDEGGEAHTAMFFVLSGEKYTVAADFEYRDKEAEDAVPWMRGALGSIEASH